MNKRLVVISYHFGPAGPVGGLRWWALTKYLTREGWDCHVVSATDVTRQLGPEEIAPSGVTHAYLPRARTVGALYRSFRQRPGRNGAAPGPEDSTRGARAGADRDPFAELNPPRPTGVSALRGEVAALLAFPDDGRGWITRAARAGRRVIREVNPAVVVSSGPPHSAHLAARAALRGESTARWLMDLRDPWGMDDISSPNVHETIRGSRWLQRTTNWLERRTMEAADGFITTTPELGDVLAARYPGQVPYCLTNGVDEEWLPRSTAEAYPGFAVAHVGTLYARRDPRPLLRAFRRFLDVDPTARNDGSRIRFAGAIEGPYQRMLDLAISELDLQEHVELMGLIPREKALEVLARSSLAVVLTQDQPLQIPAKLYEPVAMGVPTVALASRGSATDTAARRLGIGHAEPDDVEGIATCLRAVREGRAGSASRDVSRRIHYGTLVHDAEQILLHDPRTQRRPAPPAWTTR